MGLTATTSGFVIFLLSLSVAQSRKQYISSQICAVSGSTVDIRCIYRPLSTTKRRSVPVEKILWFTEMQDNRPVDLRTNPEYAGRLKYYCDRMACTLRITDLRESDSAEYKFRFKDKEDRKFTGSPGVTLSVAGPDLHVQVRRLYSTWAELFCHTTCHLPERPAYIWYKNGQTIKGETSFSYSDYLDPADSYACAVTKYEDFPAPSVCVSDQTCNRVTYTDRSICAFKGSSVDISCTFDSYDGSITSKFWFSSERSDQWQSPSQPEDLSEDSLNAGRVQVLETERGRSTLRIRDLRESDSAQYHFKFKTRSFEWRSILPGTTLTVTALQVRIIRITVYQNYTEADLMCHSSCSPSGHFSFVWFKNGQKIKEEMPAYTEDFYPGDSISCAFKGHEDSRSLSVYAPQFVSVLVSPSSECTTGSSVTLTCSSDAHPAAKYTWYKKNEDPDPQPLSKEAELVFRSIQSSDSGEYYCTAENELGRRTSESISVNVKYAPKLPSVSVSPSAEIVENSSVTLTCSSDANPAAKYTWYKEKQKLPQRSTGIYHFTSISSEDRGNYYCKSENQHGQIDSSSLFIDVQYAPKLPSVSVSPSAEIVENSSVNLTCSSDANPAAKYTWYKENEDSPKASGQIFTITDFRPEHSGNYYCEAQNRRGRHNSTLHLIVVAAAWKSVAAGMVSVVLLLVILLAVFLWMRRNKSFTQTSKAGERPDNSAQLHTSPVYGNMLAGAQRQPEEEEDELNYSSIQFSLSQQAALYSNFRPAQPHRQTEDEDEEEGVDYTRVKTDNNSSASGTRCQEDGEDLFALYSTVNKNNLNAT